MVREIVIQGRSMLLLLAIATLVVFGLGGAAIITWWQERELAGLMVIGMSMPVQLIAGALIGGIAGLAAILLLTRPVFQPVQQRYAVLIQSFGSTFMDRVMVSISAGVGEEIFFRGAIQHWAGIIITAIIFVAIHGYLDPRDKRISLYGIALVLLMIAFGYMAERWGLYAPIMAHAVFDLVLLEMLQRVKLPEVEIEVEEHPSTGSG